MSKFGIRVDVLCLLFLVLVMCQSCIKHRELIALDKGEIEEDIHTYKEISFERQMEFQPYEIQAYDQLVIRINAFDGSTEEFLNRSFASENNFSANIDYTPASLYFTSYSVDKSGHVVLPILGRINVRGLTITQLKDKLDKDYNPYLKFASTTVKVANMRVTVLGEINNPGVHYLFNEKTTLLDVMSMAGDFTDFANLQRVKLMRQEGNQTKTIFINLNRPDFIYTEYYYIQPNDVIYVEPLKQKAWDSSANSLGAIISAISIVVVILDVLFIRRN